MIFGHLGLSIDHRALDLDRASHRIDDARELSQEAVAGVLHCTAPVLGDLRLDQRLEMCLQPLVRTFLIAAHQP